ncbi:diacylglycerol lipase-beta isoform X2 [Tripterygium wilfordii]|uniref:diacylglycerol lipase-beta isoform X2 n=1 Tax=Tripterygium wilfordii TaxID=458696 RepID=UPI0018F84CE2|nr:diacylglycerol lipase-beta isoform X2 [Tripterygium wilfordii]
MRMSMFKSLRLSAVILGLCNLGVVIVGGYLVFLSCDRGRMVPVVAVSLAGALKIFAMVRSALAQQATARTILDSPLETTIADTVIRLQRRVRYKSWLWWSRFAVVITVLQVVGTTYLVFQLAKHISRDVTSTDCLFGVDSIGNQQKPKLLLLFMIMVYFVALLQCFVGPEVLRWRSFYATQDNAWKAHYEEVFDHGIREALCCLGRVEYLSTSEEDEVYSVAQLLGDLVTYRASGTGHLELLAGLALLQRQSESPKSYEGLEAPEEQIKWALNFHTFAEGAYTGPLLDVGRSPICFSCAWFYRQGTLTPWTRNRRPRLHGDNWWRGHAAAFLKYVDVPPEALRKGRVCQKKREAAYFVVVLHHIRCVVIAVRGTETPEDLITDGLGRECPLSVEDLDGLINSYIDPDVKKSVESSFPHYGHFGIVGAARDLYMHIEGNSANNGPESIGFLSSLLGAGCECDGYDLRIVGHSLGGAIATMLGLRLYSKFANLHVYTYGALPCVDFIVASACSEFVTSIVYNNEFSARLSVGAILRLRAAVITTLSQDESTDTALIFRLARSFLKASKYQLSGTEVKDPSKIHPSAHVHHIYGENLENGQEYSIWNEDDGKGHVDDDESTNPFHDMIADNNPLEDPVSKFFETVPRSENRSVHHPLEMFLAGLVVHIVPQHRNFRVPLCKDWIIQGGADDYKAYIANRESFNDITVSPSMFLDHLPWRCHKAMQKILEARNVESMHV